MEIKKTKKQRVHGGSKVLAVLLPKRREVSAPIPPDYSQPLRFLLHRRTPECCLACLVSRLLLPFREGRQGHGAVSSLAELGTFLVCVTDEGGGGVAFLLPLFFPCYSEGCSISSLARPARRLHRTARPVGGSSVPRGLIGRLRASDKGEECPGRCPPRAAGERRGGDDAAAWRSSDRFSSFLSSPSYPSPCARRRYYINRSSAALLQHQTPPSLSLCSLRCSIFGGCLASAAVNTPPRRGGDVWAAAL